MNFIGLVILSAFCIAGLYSYSARALRLEQLLRSGKRAGATVLNKIKVDSVGKTPGHNIIEYEFTDESGKILIHEQDLTSRKFFNKLSVGDKVEIIYTEHPRGISYPQNQIQSELNFTKTINGAIIVFWGIMGVILI